MLVITVIRRTKAPIVDGVTSHLAGRDVNYTPGTTVGLVGIPAKTEDVRVQTIVAGTWTI